MDYLSIAAQVLRENLPTEIISSVTRFSVLGSNCLAIKIYSSEYKINGVSGQHPDIASFLFDIDDKSLTAQAFQYQGGRKLYRKPDVNNPNEKYLALGSEKIAFRRPKITDQKSFERAIKKIAENYMKTLHIILESGLHCHSEEVKYAQKFLQNC